MSVILRANHANWIVFCVFWCAFCGSIAAQSPQLLMVAGQQQFVSANPACGQNAWVSSDPQIISVQQLSMASYRLQALKTGYTVLTLNCAGQMQSFTITVQSGEYKSAICPDVVESGAVVPPGWTVENHARERYELKLAQLEATTLICAYGDRSQVILRRKMEGRCNLSPNKKGAYCQ
jgi:hypothetical protein